MRPLVLRGLAFLLVAVAAGCGDDGSDRAASTIAGRPTTSTAAEPVRTGDEAAVAEVGERYLRGIAEHDWDAVCATREAKERASLARTAGSCVRAFELILKEKPGFDDIFAEAEIGDVRIEGDVAGVDIVQPGQSEPATTIAAVRRGSRWYLQDRADTKTP